MESIIAIGKVLGIPGVVILCWYLLEVRKGEREKASDKQNAENEKERIAVENKRTEAMQEGFRSLAQLINDHAARDLESHGEQTERIARIEGALEIRRQTPVRGVPMREINRAKTGGDR